jgi:Uma2 family endonuclease
MAEPAQRSLTAAEFLERERRAEQRSEFYQGEAFLLAGASRQHNRIATNVSADLDRQLEGRDCDVYTNDLMVLVERTGLYTYPDVLVTCGEERFADDHADVLLNPLVIVEILSPSTEAYDRGKKFEHYQQIDSLTEYVLITQDAVRVEHFRREDGGWLYTELSDADGVLDLPSIGCRLALDRVYRRAVPRGPVSLR